MIEIPWPKNTSIPYSTSEVCLHSGRTSVSTMPEPHGRCWMTKVVDWDTHQIPSTSRPVSARPMLRANPFERSYT